MARLLFFVTGFALGAAAILLLSAEAETAPVVSPVRSDRPAPGEAGRCSAATSSGRRCSRAAEPGSDRCWQHGG